MAMSTAAWNYALQQTARGPIGASAVINSANVAPRPPLPSYPQPVFRTPLPYNHYASGARGVEFSGKGLPGGGITRGATFAAPGTAGVGAAGAGTGLGFAGTAAAVVGAAAAGLAVGEAINGAIGNKYPGDRNAVQYFGDLLFPGSAIANGSGEPINVGGSVTPFTGGQSPGVQYRVRYRLTNADGNTFGPYTLLVYGPLQGPFSTTTATGDPGYPFDTSVSIRYRGFSGEVFTAPLISQSWGKGQSAPSAQIISTSREDGLEDTGGDPPPFDEKGRSLGAPTLPTNRDGTRTAPPSTDPTKTEEPKKYGPPPPIGDPISPVKKQEPGENERKAPPLDLPNFPPVPPFFLPAPPPGDTKIGNPADPSTWEKKDPTKPPTPPGSPPACPCNIPVMEGIGDLGRKIDGIGGGGSATGFAAVLLELSKISGAIGVGGLPANVPSNIANPSTGMKSIGSLAELHLWQTEQLDGLLGQFPNKTRIQTPGGPQDIDIPNVSESLSEIIGMLVGLTISSTEILHTSSRALHQAGSATQQAHLAHLFGKANAEFLGYEGANPSVDVPMAYSPGKNPFSGLLDESTQKIRGWENRDGQDLKKILAELLQAAHIIKEVHFKKINPKGNFKDQMQADLRAQSTYLDGEATRKNGSSDWEAYLNQVEQGFSTKTGDENPYGRPPTEGPKIRDLSSEGGTQ